MKTLAELQAIREKTLNQIRLGKDEETRVRVVVGMATCGIAAGARPVMDEFAKQVNDRALKDIKVVQTGCIGVCRLEPIVEVYVKGESKVTYVKMTPDKVERIVNEHLVNGKPVEEFTIGYAEQHRA